MQVWKDVDGILTADPRLWEPGEAGPGPVSEVSFEEAAELAYFGAQVGMAVDWPPLIPPFIYAPPPLAAL